jgi:hypothetical protein
MAKAEEQTTQVVQKVIDSARLAKVYVKLRDAKDKILRDAEQEADVLKAKMDVIEAAMLGFMNANKVDSVATTAGTFYKELSIKPSCSDWDVFYQWIKKNDTFEFLERRVTRNAIKEFMEANKGTLPPGINVHKEYVVRVRRK